MLEGLERDEAENPLLARMQRGPGVQCGTVRIALALRRVRLSRFIELWMAL